MMLTRYFWRGLLLMAAFELVSIWLSKAELHVFEPWYVRLSNKMLGFTTIFLIFLLIIFAWFSAVRDSQFSPHLITQSINGHVLSSVMVTNPMYLTSYRTQRVGVHGFEYDVHVRTNYYWRVWSIFKL